jgi:hypothetical protein
MFPELRLEVGMQMGCFCHKDNVFIKKAGIACLLIAVNAHT